MTRCPHCFRGLGPDVYAYICVSGRCQLRADPEATALHGSDVAVPPWIRQVRPPGNRSWAPTPGPVCPTCATACREACPECRYELPSGWREGDSVCIAMAGARATGKSVYVGVLVKLLAQLAEGHDSALAPANERTDQIYREVYEKALFEQRGLLPSTPPVSSAKSYQRHPLIYSLGVIGGRRRWVVLRDVAGEDLESQDGSPAHLQFFRHADGVVFMFDPLKVPEVRDQLHDVVPNELSSGGDPMAVLSKVLRLVEDGPARVAVVLSKFDTLQLLADVEGMSWNRVMANPGAAFMRDAAATRRGYDAVDGELLHEEVRSLLIKLGASSLVSSLERPHRARPIEHRFFAVSALGEPANGDTRHERGISPFRSLDPALWLFSTNGLIA